MKVHSILFTLLTTIFLLVIPGATANAQQYKLRQVTSMTGMKTETTIYVKGARKRTEGGGYMGIGANIVTIEQCDLQRTIKFNDKKKLFYIEPFSKYEEEEEGKPAAKPKVVPAATKDKSTPKTGGTVYMYYNITDTGERKKMYGFTARHVWTTQKIKPSADACMMKDSMVIKTDGWYIDLPLFNCPVTGVNRSGYSAGTRKIECQDRYVSRRSGKGKLGFPLIETKTMIMGNAAAKTTEFETNLETLELSTVKLDSMLFEIPLGYTETKNEEDLQDKMDISQMMKQGGYDRSGEKTIPAGEKRAGVIRIGVFEPTGEESLQVAVIQQHLVNTVMNGNVEAVAVSSKDDAKSKKCDLLLQTDFTKVKQASKVGSLLKAIKNTDPSASSSFNIDANLTLTSIVDGSTRGQEKVSGKFDGKVDDAAMKALDKGCSQLVKGLR